MLALTKSKEQTNRCIEQHTQKDLTNYGAEFSFIFELISKFSSFNKLDVFDEDLIIKKKPLSQLKNLMIHMTHGEKIPKQITFAQRNSSDFIQRIFDYRFVL